MAARGKTKKLETRIKRTLVMDNRTYKGRINIGISRLKSLFPDKQIILLTPLHRSFADSAKRMCSRMRVIRTVVANMWMLMFLL